MQIEFASEQTVTGVALMNRADQFGERLKDAVVTVGNSAMSVGQLSTNPICIEFTGPSTTGALHALQCTTPLTGKYVILQLVKNPRQIQLNEMVVFGNSCKITIGLVCIMFLCSVSFSVDPLSSVGKPPVCKSKLRLTIEMTFSCKFCPFQQDWRES